jgi:hypothetical protein
MKLTKITYGSAVFFGVVTFVSTLVIGLLIAMFPEVGVSMGILSDGYLMALYSAVFQGVSIYLGVLIMIAIYNLIATKYPISWEVDKK